MLVRHVSLVKLTLAKYTWFDGRFVTGSEAMVPITTHAIQYGTAVFEGIRAYQSAGNLYIFRLHDHIRRFRRSGEFYSMRLGYTDAQVAGAVISTCVKNNLRKSSYIRPFYFIGQYGINLHVTKRAPTHMAVYAFPFGDLFDKNGITAGVVSWRKFSDMSAPPQAKMAGNYLNSIIATQEARREGYDEAIMLDMQGNVSEAPGENIFVVRDGALATPAADSSALEGITCDTVATLARESGIEVTRRRIARSELYLADEVFLTGTAAEITPVRSVDGKKIRSPGPITKKLVAMYEKTVTGGHEKHADWLTAVY